MPETDYRALCARMADELDHYRQLLMDDRRETHALAAEARAALAQPEPVAPTDDELLKLLSRASGLPDCDTYIVDGGRIMSEPNELLAFARAVLARWGTPANNTREELIMSDPDYKALCKELVEAYAYLIDRYMTAPSNKDALVYRARTALNQPEPTTPMDEESDAFAIVQMRLDNLAGDQELMIYRWPDGEWSIDHTNPTSSVQLGEVNGVYGATGSTLDEVVRKLAALLSANNTGGTH